MSSINRSGIGEWCIIFQSINISTESFIPQQIISLIFQIHQEKNDSSSFNSRNSLDYSSCLHNQQSWRSRILSIFGHVRDDCPPISILFNPYWYIWILIFNLFFPFLFCVIHINNNGLWFTYCWCFRMLLVGMQSPNFGFVGPDPRCTASSVNQVV